MPHKLIAVIVTFNRLDKLKFTLARTLEQPFYKVVVVDNCSTDGTEQWLATTPDDRLEVVTTEKNLGGAGGFNVGFKHAASSFPEAEWLVCYDDDAYPRETLCQQFEKLSIPDEVAGIAGAVYLPSGGISEMNRPSLVPFWHVKQLLGAALRGRAGFHVSDSAYDSEQCVEVDASSFVGFFMRLSLIRNGDVGLPRSELFIYADDIIYIMEMRKRGWKHWFVPTLEFEHDCQTLVDQKDVYHPLWRVYYTYRNRLEMYRIASGVFYPVVLLLKIPLFFLTVRHYEANERRRFMKITRVAIWDGLRRDYTKSHEQIMRLGEAS